MEKSFGPVVVGEWSMATDNCAMWLNGFNDNLPGFPHLPCKYVPCPEPYMGTDQPGTPVDPSKPIQGPYGTGLSGPILGLCPVSRDWIKESSKDENGDAWINAPPEAAPHKDDSDSVMTQLALKKINAFYGIGHGFYFWNFRTEIDEPHWSYMLALEKGWIPRGNLNSDLVNNACRKEDDGIYICIAKRNQIEASLRKSIKQTLNETGKSQEEIGSVDTMNGDGLYDKADRVFNRYWTSHRIQGATCDFGGLATLQEMNKTYTDGDIGDDLFFNRGPPGKKPVILKIFWTVMAGILGGGVIGFFLAMRISTRFNKSISKRLTKSMLGQKLKGSNVFDQYFKPTDSDLDYNPVLASIEIQNISR